MAKQFRPVVVYGNDTTLYIRMKRFDKSTGEYIDFNMEQVTDLSVSLICSQHNTDIPLTFTVDGNLITCAIEYRLLHPNASYGIIVEGIDEDQKHFRFEMLSREGFLVVSNTSGMKTDDNIETIDIQGRVGWGISYNGDLTNYYTKSEVDNLIAEIEIDLSDYYTKEEINQLVNQFPTKSEIDARFNDYYTKTQVNGLISDLENIVDDKQDTLVSGVNIKTINNESILGEGNIDIQGGGGSVEPIIVNYGEVIPDETIAKILEQKTDIFLHKGNFYYACSSISDYRIGFEHIVASDGLYFTWNEYYYLIGVQQWNTTTLNTYKKSASDGLLRNKQDTLVSGSNIKTINNESILGEGNIDIQAGEDYSEQIEVNTQSLVDLDNRIKTMNQSFGESIGDIGEKLEDLENNTNETLDSLSDNINEQFSSTATILKEHSERLAVQSDWNESDSSSLAYIQNKPTISTPVQSDWNETDTTSLAYIQNKPTIQTQVQSDWNESDTTSLAYIQNKPTIQSPVQSDWNESDTTSLAYIQNKPSISEPGFVKLVNGNKTGLVNSLSTNYNTNIGKGAVIEGNGHNAMNLIEASADFSHAEGYNSKAQGACSHAEGQSTAQGVYSHAEGQSRASGQNSHSEGQSIAEGTNSHAEGSSTNAKGTNSHTSGYQTIANNRSEFAIGQWNTSVYLGNNTFDPTNANASIFTVGNGTSNSARHNAFDIKMNGDIYLNDGTHPVSSNTNGLKIEVVSALPATPDANTIYVIQ
jgi:hypothetical protein